MLEVKSRRIIKLLQKVRPGCCVNCFDAMHAQETYTWQKLALEVTLEFSLYIRLHSSLFCLFRCFFRVLNTGPLVIRNTTTKKTYNITLGDLIYKYKILSKTSLSKKFSPFPQNLLILKKIERNV